MEESNVDSWLVNFEMSYPSFLQDFEQLDQLAPSPMIPNISSISPECCFSNSNSDPNPSPEICTTSPLRGSNITDKAKKKRKPRNKSWNTGITKGKKSTDGEETGKSDGTDNLKLSPTAGRGRKRSYDAKSDVDTEKNSTGSADQVTQLGPQKKDHVMAERLRREKLTQRFIALSSLLPGLSRMDKASVLEDAIKYVKQLQDRVKTLEAQTLPKAVPQPDIEKKSQLSPDECNSSTCAESSLHDVPSNKGSLPEIEVRISQQSVLIKIHCDSQKGILGKAMSEIEKLGLIIVTTSVVPFTSSTIDMTITAKANEELSLTVEDLVKRINSAFK
ncbi:basic helix-loop-helix (bHLH) DNA-binding superfamily protein [Rhynchospora pubera]|uniref:Basic helix-loop-helix (BHLH) DNA-binding superfamily protein n=1 Tax=Rhynchospora pubera TaxID=906938 RepID=A0AAV8BTX7_9POAL|nr:basic helix-loop-helix (bHLH) DNA-binding superfamily protein [Rhynchospora pubera]